jgi:hypothetical protein
MARPPGAAADVLRPVDSRREALMAATGLMLARKVVAVSS